ncbi:SpoIID/LytB domain-containing protein [Bacillus zanthoxyli]|nr:SpoIID/LytB domain-containing protein [Bacillus zanthoxyli]
MKKVIFLSLLCVVVFATSFFGNLHAEAASTNPIIKVKLVNYLGNKNEITVKTSENADTSDANLTFEKDQLYRLKIENSKIIVYKNGIKINTYDSLMLYTNQNVETLINNRLYSGSVKFTVEKDEFVRPINYILLEKYLQGVVPNEMIPSWNVEALKAQAIAARTYAMGYVNSTINDTVQYQVYGGNTFYPNSNKAVTETYGQTLTYGGKLISALYSSSNGGKIESSVNAWNGGSVSYLQVKDDPYDPTNPWSVTIDKKQIDLTDKDLKNVDSWWGSVQETNQPVVKNIKEYLKQNGYKDKDIKITDIPLLSFENKTSGNRYSLGNFEAKFIVKGDVNENGELKVQTLNKTKVNSSIIRPIIGTSVMKSYYVTDQRETDTQITLSGLGFGHGVGMSQYGAKAMADQGKTYQDILSFYYPGTTYTKQYEGEPSFEAKRIYGANRYETAVEIAKQGWTQADTVVIANGENFPDALAGAPLAAQENAPLLLTPVKQLSPVVKEEIKRLKATKAIILGSSGVVSINIENELKTIGVKQIDRISGTDRFDTAAKISKRLDSTKAIITNGFNFPDALSVAPYASKNKIPILLTKNDNLPKITADALSNKNETIVLGSSGPVNDDVFKALPNPVRYAGADRYETNAKIIKNLKMGTDTAYIAAGTNFPDALAGSVLAAKNNSPILLTTTQEFPPSIAGIIGDYKQFNVLGSNGVVGDSIVQKLNVITYKNNIQ